MEKQDVFIAFSSFLPLILLYFLGILWRPPCCLYKSAFEFVTIRHKTNYLALFIVVLKQPSKLNEHDCTIFSGAAQRPRPAGLSKNLEGTKCAPPPPLIEIGLMYITKIGGDQSPKVPINSGGPVTDHGEGNARFSKKYISRLAMGNKESKQVAVLIVASNNLVNVNKLRRQRDQVQYHDCEIAYYIVHDFLPNWMIFFHFSSSWFSDLQVTKNCDFC